LDVSPDLSSNFIGLRVVELTIGDLKISRSRTELDDFKREKQDEIRLRLKSSEIVKDLPVVRSYRDFYWSVGIDPTKTRPAGEALLRRILGGRDLPTINTFVDSYNLASAESCVAIAAFDLDVVDGDNLLMRRARSGEAFLGIGMQSAVTLSGIEVVIEDLTSGKLIAIYPYRDSEDSKVTEKSSDVLLMMCGVPGVSDEDLQHARSLTEQYVERFCR
jgi:DNA/RNA-binding domain of Phe-tRNA-synthetase-like protein